MSGILTGLSIILIGAIFMILINKIKELEKRIDNLTK